LYQFQQSPAATAANRGAAGIDGGLSERQSATLLIAFPTT
jgi:hypothetical protein